MNKNKIVSGIISVVCVSAMCVGIVSVADINNSNDTLSSAIMSTTETTAVEKTVVTTEAKKDSIETSKVIPISPMDSVDYYNKKENIDLKATKDYIYYKMLNTIDYYDNVAGSFSTANGDINNPMNVEFESNLISGKSYEHITMPTYDYDVETYTENGTFTEYSNNKKSYEKMYGAVSKKEADTIENSERVTIEFDGNKGYHYRANPTNISMASVCLLPQEMTFGFLENQELWTIKGTEKLFDRDCVVINGIADKDYGEKLGVNEFVFYVDLNTGVLLKYEGFNKDGILSDFMYVKEISFSDKIKVKSKSNYIEEYSDYNEDKSLAIK